MTDGTRLEVAMPAPQEPTELFGCPVTGTGMQRAIHISRDRYEEVMGSLKADGFTFLTDVTAVDYLIHAAGRTLPDGIAGERFEVVANLLDMGTAGTDGPRRLRARVQVPEQDPTVASLFDLWPGADAMEREVYDLMGVVFVGHPDLTRILMPDAWEGHPLRKDYAVGRIPVQFKEAPQPR